MEKPEIIKMIESENTGDGSLAVGIIQGWIEGDAYCELKALHDYILHPIDGNSRYKRLYFSNDEYHFAKSLRLIRAWGKNNFL